MASGVSFFTPIKSTDHPYWSIIDKSFINNGKKAIVQPCACHIAGSQGVKIDDSNEVWYKNAMKIGTYLSLGYFTYKLTQKTPSQIFHHHKLEMFLIGSFTALFLAKVYYRVTTHFHVCPPAEGPIFPQDLIPENVRPHLITILAGYTNNIIHLPHFRGTSAPKFEEMTAPVMMGIIESQGGKKPYIAIKIRTSDEKQSGIIFLTPKTPDDPTQWEQIYNSNLPQLYDPKDERGKLQQFIQDGRCTHNGIEWEIVGHPKERIAEPVQILLNELLGKRGPVDKLPVLEGFQDLVPTPEKVTHPVMKCFITGFATVVIKLRSGINERLLVLGQASETEPNVWMQLKPENNDIYPVFFDQLTDESGKLDMNALLSFDKLKELIQNGSGKDLKGRQWELVT